MESIAQSEFDLNRETLEPLLRDPLSLDLIELKDVTDQIEKVLLENKLPRDVWGRFILTGSFAATLAGIGDSYSDLDLFTYKDVNLKGNYGKIEFVVKKKWRDIFNGKISKDKYQRQLTFASLIIHLFDLDCCRFVCVQDKDERWILYTCSSGQRFLREKINYVDRFNARSLKVHSRIQKYKERGILSLVEIPDRINIAGDIYTYAPKPKDVDDDMTSLLRRLTGKKISSRNVDKPNIVFDNRDLPWFLTNQHGIEITKLLPWYRVFLKKSESSENIRQVILDTIEKRIKTHSAILPAVMILIEKLPIEYIDMLHEEIHKAGRSGKSRLYSLNTPFDKCRYKYDDTHYFIPIVHKKKVYWMQIVHGEEYKILSISFFAYEDYNNYRSRYKTYSRHDKDAYVENLEKCPLPDKAKENGISVFKEREDDESDDDSEYESDSESDDE